METLSCGEKSGFTFNFFLNTKSNHNCTKIWALLEWHISYHFIFLKCFISKRKYIYTVNKKKVKSRFKHVLHDIFKKYFKHNYNIMIETVLAIKKTVDNLFGVKSLI